MTASSCSATHHKLSAAVAHNDIWQGCPGMDRQLQSAARPDPAGLHDAQYVRYNNNTHMLCHHMSGMSDTKAVCCHCSGSCYQIPMLAYQLLPVWCTQQACMRAIYAVLKLCLLLPCCIDCLLQSSTIGPNQLCHLNRVCFVERNSYWIKFDGAEGVPTFHRT